MVATAIRRIARRDEDAIWILKSQLKVFQVIIGSCKWQSSDGSCRMKTVPFIAKVIGCA